MRVAIVDQSINKVVLVLIQDTPMVPPNMGGGFLAVGSSIANVGDGWDGVSIIPQTIPPSIPQSITHRQFFHQLGLQGLILPSEAIAAVRAGTPPATIQTFISGLPLSVQFAAIMKIAGDANFSRNDALIMQLGNALGLTPDQLDQFFTNASGL